MNDLLTQSPLRDIIDDFANELKTKMRRGPSPSKAVIRFRNEHLEGTTKERDVMQVPVELLRFRKDNGRIALDVLSYEKNRGPLDEQSKNAQEILRKFLKDNDPQKTEELKKDIRQNGQREPAIVTVDGFLINGNRRKMVLEQLEGEQYKWIKVVFLPGKDDEGGPPTLKEIKQIENRYQLQTEGRSEYYKFNMALTIRNNIENGMPLEEQLQDNSQFSTMSPKNFEKAVRKYKEEFLSPLDCIDEYLEALERPGLYNTVSTGVSDREGRWEAFVDWSKFHKKLKDKSQLLKMKIEESEVGDVKDIAIKIIRKREFPGLKVHSIMREYPKWLADKNAKKEIFKLRDIPLDLPESERYDQDGNEYDEKEKDKLWGATYKDILYKQVKSAQRMVDRAVDLENPLGLLDAALKKLTHRNMHLTIRNEDLEKAMKLAEEVKDKADELKKDFYRLHKNVGKDKQQLQDKYGHNRTR